MAAGGSNHMSVQNPGKAWYRDYMDMKEAARIVSNWAATHPEILSVYFYGSRVDGDPGPDSDLDVCFELDDDAMPDNYSEPFAFGPFIRDEWEQEIRVLLPAVHLEWFHREYTTRVCSGAKKSVYHKYKRV